MNWTKINYNENMDYRFQETLPIPGKHIVCCTEDEKFSGIKSTIMEIRNEMPSIDGTFDLNGIWWRYIDLNGLPKYIIENLSKDINKKCNSHYNQKNDGKMCECGHTYYRHFDPHENMSFTGCKYCGCQEFVEQIKE